MLTFDIVDDLYCTLDDPRYCIR